ncbi:anti-sigma factor [Paenibacillus sp. 1001270B_150601_E10]|uniref:anti-sigma factor n=1 Tax=Paenibacillus sp. 1001270B_150601_E10 TaxID=2787079 RepID=UPI00189E5294|nr:anti-sigma factor [Paenibacillus sp. 1001270B_150601_E10]
MSDHLNMNRLHRDPQHAQEQGKQHEHFTETEWIDYILQSLPQDKALRMTSHLADCKTCMEHHEYWMELVGTEGMLNSAGTTHDDLTELVPPKWIKRRLHWRVRLTGLMHKLREGVQAPKKRRLFGASACVAIVLMAGIIGWQQQSSPWDHYVQQYEPEAVSVMSNPQSESYPIEIGQLKPDSSVVWYNANSREMLMLFGGLMPKDNEYVRVWAMHEGTRQNLGVLKYHAYRAHLYVKGQRLDEADHFFITIEPKHGYADQNAVETIWFELPGMKK